VRQQQAAYTAEGVDTAKKSLTDYNNQILAEQNSLNHAKDAIYNAPGVSREGANAQFSEVQRVSLSKQADLSIFQYVAQNRYADAKSIADRKIEMQFEPLQTKLDALKFFYQENKDTLTKAEDRLYQAKITKDESTLKIAYDREKTLQDTKLSVIKAASESGAPSSVLQAIQNSSTPEGAYSAAGKYGIDVLRQLQIAKARKDLVDTNNPSGVPNLNSPEGNTSVDNDVRAILEGRNTAYNIRQTMGRTNAAAAYMQKVRDKINALDPNFDFVASDAGGKSVSTSYVQRATASINSVLA